MLTSGVSLRRRGSLRLPVAVEPALHLEEPDEGADERQEHPEAGDPAHRGRLRPSAVEAAQRAFPAWRDLVARERARILRRWADLVLEHQEDLAVLLTLEQGKPLAESRAEVAYAGLPAGVFNVVTGDADDAPVIGGELTSSPIVRKLGFTGSTAVGKLLMAQCAGTVKKVSLELGGNAPFIVFDDADLDVVMQAFLACKFRNSGQTCISANRILVQEEVFDEVASRLADLASGLKVAPGLEEGSQVGPLIDEQGLEKVKRHVADATGGGAEVLVGGGQHALGHTFFEPTVLTGVAPDMAMSCEETFGPVAGLIPFRTEEEAVRIANDTPYGLCAYFYTRDVGRAWRVGEALEAGIVALNTGFVSTEVAPFGGVKESGVGREGSKYGMDDFLEIKYLCMGGV